MIRFIKVRNSAGTYELINVNYIIKVIPQKSTGSAIFIDCDDEILYTEMTPEEMDKLLFKI